MRKPAIFGWIVTFTILNIGAWAQEGFIRTSGMKTPGSICDNNLSIQVSSDPDSLVAGFIEYGVSISNVTYTGAPVSLGEFHCDTLGVLEMMKGIVLSSGRVVDAVGPNNHTNTSASTGGGSDPDLQAYAGFQNYDAAVLEFDLIPENNFLAFNFVFGSEEYHEFVNQYNDIFCFFITGPDPSGGTYENVNIATIPGTDLPVSINNLNNGTSNSGPCVNCQYLIDNGNGAELEFDAFTTLIQVGVFVIPDQLYHLKIAIGDVLDRLYDSGIFLQSPSLKSYHVVGIHDTPESFVPKVSPNPVTQASALSFSLNSPEYVRADVIDATGRNVLKLADAAFAAGEHHLAVGNTGLKGLHLIRLSYGNKVTTAKVIF
ncbi:MAG: choice-of-anchor L domain-containing protein [Bacteroidales bacterium]|nr:choice-of-anchor L domain-containing protein [Bacteroidales bacterium]